MVCGVTCDDVSVEDVLLVDEVGVGDEELLAATRTHEELVKSETLALELVLVAGEQNVSVVRL